MPGMDLKSIHVVGRPLVRASAAEVADAESQLWITFPKGSGAHVGEYQLFTQLDGRIMGSGEALMYPQAVALAQNWLGLVLE